MACYIRPHAIPSNAHPNFTPFNPLLSFLEDFATQFQPDNATSTTPHRQTRNGCASKKSETKPASTPTPTYTPRFDIVEKDTAFELYGELPGVKVEDISVEFSDEKTLVISGSSARTGAASETSASTPSQTSIAASEPESATETTSLKGKEKQKQASVDDADDFEDLSDSVSATTRKTSDSTTAPDPETQSPDELDAAASSAKANNPAPEHKFVLSERKYGTFSRTFQFSVPVEKEEVGAKLKDGVLVVSVPKRIVRSQRVRVSID